MSTDEGTGATFSEQRLDYLCSVLIPLFRQWQEEGEPER